MKLFKNQTLFILCLIILFGLFLRCFNLNWDDGHFLHPDERLYVNASSINLPSSLKEFLSPASPLNPHMFYYGTFPLYIYKAVSVLFFGNESFLFISRLVSALFSTATILVVFLIGRKTFDKKVGLLSAFCFAFAPGSIQYAHFNTTESILIFLLSTILYFSIKLYKNFSLWYVVILALLSAFSYGTKITGLTFLTLPMLAFLPLLVTKKWKRCISSIAIFLFVFLSASFMSAPYQILDWKVFADQQTYMQGVTLGTSKPPFVIIYENTLPYIYPLLNSMFFTFGFISLPIGLLGCFLIVKAGIIYKRFKYLYLFILVFPLLYFMWAGIWYVKFERYYLLLLPFFALWAGYTLSKLNKKIYLILLFLIFLNGVLYLRVYFFTNTRVAASAWIYKNIKTGSTISGEHWDDNLPLPLPEFMSRSYTMNQLTVYDPDSQEKIRILSHSLSTSDYFIISSGRVYRSILINKKTYPLTSNFYQLLFSNKLGFLKIKTFTNYPFFFSDDVADESFQSYDHPPVLIFQNKKHLSPSQIQDRIIHYEK